MDVIKCNYLGSIWPGNSLQMVKPHANYWVDILKARWLRPAFAESLAY